MLCLHPNMLCLTLLQILFLLLFNIHHNIRFGKKIQWCAPIIDTEAYTAHID